MQQTIQLSRGHLNIEVQQHHPEWSIDQLLDFAERINPKRAFLFVSKVLGKHIPVSPSLMQKTYHSLAEFIPNDLPTPISLVAMAETAIGLGAGIYREMKPKWHEDALFLTTTRHQLEELPTLAVFLEEHSHAQDQCILGSHHLQKQQHIMQSKTLIIVDDEISTGKTIQNLCQGLQQAGMQHIERIIVLSLVNWADPQLAHLPINLPIQVYSLLHGTWSWHDNGQPMTLKMPQVNTIQQPEQKILAPDWGREPSYLESLPWRIPQAQPDEKILILGSGEFSWIPFLIAEQLEHQGASVLYSATTRSPIMLGGAIKQHLQFQDNYGMNIPNYVYNVDPKRFDRVILVIETAKNSVDPALFAQIPNLEVFSYVE